MSKQTSLNMRRLLVGLIVVLLGALWLVDSTGATADSPLPTDSPLQTQTPRPTPAAATDTAIPATWRPPPWPPWTATPTAMPPTRTQLGNVYLPAVIEASSLQLYLPFVLRRAP